MIGGVLAVTLAPLLAAGGVVDVAIATEARATQSAVDDPSAIDTTQAQGGFVLRPAVTGALRHEGLAGSLTYSPALSMLARVAEPGQTLYSVLHSLELRGESGLGRRARIRSSVAGAIGELDPASAQSTLQRSSGVLDPLVSLPYGSLAVRLGGGADLSRRMFIDVNGSVDVASSLGDDRIPLTVSPNAEVSGSWQATRADALIAGVNVQSSLVDGRGGFFGGGPALGWRRQLGSATGLALHGGVGAYSASDDESAPLTVLLPRATAELYTLLDLAGDAALEAGTRATVTAVNDPLGTLLENRASLSVDGGVRFSRDLALRGEVTAFAPAFVYAQRGPTSSNTYAARTVLAWIASEHFAVETGVLLTTRIIEDIAQTDALLSIALSGTAPVWHTGGRPAGSGSRRNAIGFTQVGDPPRPGATTVTEPPALDIMEEPAPNPALVPPSGVVDPNATDPSSLDPNAPPASGTLRPLTDEEKKKAEEAKKKRREGDSKPDEDPRKDPKEGDAKDDKDDAKEDAKSEG